MVRMTKRDYYDVLGITRAASDQDIKAAFRRLAKECHPDTCNGDTTSEKRFKEVNEAYEVLKDADKRAAYDRFGHAAFEHGGPGPAGGFGADFASTFSDIFDDLFGMGGRRGRLWPMNSPNRSSNMADMEAEKSAPNPCGWPPMPPMPFSKAAWPKRS